MAKKRKSKAKHYAGRRLDANIGTMDVSSSSAPPPLPVLEVLEFKLTNEINDDKTTISPPPFRMPEEDDTGEWELPGRNKKPKKEKAPKSKNYPEFVVSPQRLKRHLVLNDLQGLVLWLSADAPAPQWLLVRHKPEIRRVVVLMVPGLTMNMFDGSLDLRLMSDDEGDDEKKSQKEIIGEGEASGDYFPVTLDRRKLAPCVQAMAGMFPYVWPVKAAGDDRLNKMHSPITTFLTSPLPKNTDAVKAPSSPQSRMRITQLLMTLNELVENEYPLHSSQLEEARKNIGEEEFEGKKLFAKQESEGWVETSLLKGNNQDKNQAGSIIEGKTIYSLDCEMCQTNDGLELTRISIVDWNSTVVYDTLVKPTKPITDYLTAYSGITKEKLQDITITLSDVQNHLLSIFNDDTILVGQSLNSDLVAIKLSHPHIVDTSCIYHHARGPPYKASLKWLAQRFLKREIQSSGVTTGHDSVEDARACLDLLKLKLEKGSRFGTSDDNRESIFKRLSRPPHGPRHSAIVDYGEPQKWHGAHASAAIACSNDTQVAAAVVRCVKGDSADALPAMDFTWGRFRTLENTRLFNSSSPVNSDSAIDIDGPLPEVARDPPTEELVESVHETVKRIQEVYDALSPCTAFVVYSGTGDPRKWQCMNELHRRFKAEYKVRKWDDVGVKWTDVENQILRASFQAARRGVGFMVVK